MNQEEEVEIIQFNRIEDSWEILIIETKDRK